MRPVMDDGMPGKSITEVKALAKKQAEARGHKIKRWNGKSGRYTAVCEKCRAGLSAYPEAQNYPGLEESNGDNGIIIARSCDMYWTGLDFYFARGEALMIRCY